MRSSSGNVVKGLIEEEMLELNPEVSREDKSSQARCTGCKRITQTDTGVEDDSSAFSGIAEDKGGVIGKNKIPFFAMLKNYPEY